MARPYLLFGQKKKHKPGREKSDQQQRQPGSGAEKHYCSVTQQSRSVPAGNELPVGMPHWQAINVSSNPL